jgi:predicted AAA+ superfamily ATPase
LGLFGHLESPVEGGFVFENLVFLLLRQKLGLKAAKLNFWRTKDKAEVDFVIEAGKRLIPVEVKYTRLKQDKVPASLRRFIDRYKPERAYIINLNFSKTLDISGTTLSFLPVYELLRQTTIL